MSSSKDYLNFVLEQLSQLEEITYRAMMGEYILYYRGKVIGGIYDDRLLVKPVKSALSLTPTASYELPYEGVKEMLLVDSVDNKEFLTNFLMRCMRSSPHLRKRSEPIVKQLEKPATILHKSLPF